MIVNPVEMTKKPEQAIMVLAASTPSTMNSGGNGHPCGRGDTHARDRWNSGFFRAGFTFPQVLYEP